MKDYLVRGLVNSKNCRVFACKTTNLVDEARKHHNLWPTASAAIGRMMSATLMMAKMNKNQEKMTVVINGGGPIGTMMTVTNGDGNIKGFVANPEVHYTYNDTGKLAVGVAVGHEGTLQVIRDMGLKEPYVGQIALQTGEIAEDLTYYFATSEQIPSAVGLGVLVDKDLSVRQAGGFIIQLMPFTSDEVIEKLENKIREIASVTEMLEQGMTPEQILEEILGDFGLEISDKIPAAFECDCSKERVSRAISTLSKKDLDSIINDGEAIEVKCQFCNKAYHFDVDELKEMRSAK